jgi:acid phosphatase
VAVVVAIAFSACGSPAASGRPETSFQPGASILEPVTTDAPFAMPGPSASSVAAAPRSPASGPATSPRSATVPAFAHVYLIVMENHEYGSIVGSSYAPYINSLIRRYGLATNFDSVAHPSEPNYLALFAGSTFGIRDDGTYNLTAKNLADQLQAHGRTWHVYAQDLPSSCSTVASARGGVDLVGLAGTYARKHEPAISFTDISRTTRCTRITRLTSFSPTAASFELIVPNMTNDMHDGTIAQGDAFLHAFVPRITTSAAFAHSLLLITWDEGSTSLGGGGHVATLVISPSVSAGRRSSVSHTHYSILRTIEDAWGLGCLAHSCTANDLREFFG